MFEISEITSYKVRYNFRGNKRYQKFFTLEKAVDKIGWWMIFDKYKTEITKGADFFGESEVVTKNPSWLVCECESRINDYDWKSCPIHDRETGYFARLHKKLVKKLYEEISHE